MQLFRLYLTVSSLLILPATETIAQQTPVNLEAAGRFDGDFAPAVQQGRKVLLHASGNIVVDKLEERLQSRQCIVRKNGFAGVIDSTGKVIVPFAYDDVSRHSDFHFFILKKNGRTGVADSTGKVVAGPEFDEVEGLHRSAAAFKSGKTYGWLDLSTGTRHPSPYRVSRSYIADPYFDLSQGELKGLLHEQKGMVIPVQYDMIRAAYPGTVVVEKQGKAGLLSLDGRELAPLVYDELSWSWEDSLLRAKQHDKTGLLNAEGRLTVPAKYDRLQRANHKQLVAVLNGKYGVIDVDGRERVPFVYDGITTTDASGRELLNYADKKKPEDPFLAYVVKKGERYGLLDWNGQLLLPAVYDAVAVTTINRRAYIVVFKGQKTGLFSREGKQLLLPVYDLLAPANQSNSGFTYYATDAARPAASKLIRAEKGGRSGLFDLDGREVVPVKYESLRWESNGLLLLKNGDTTAVATADGKLVRAPQRNVYYHMIAADRMVEGEYGNYRMTGLDGKEICKLRSFEFDRVRNGIGDSSLFYAGLMKAGDYNNQNVFVTRDGQEVRFDAYQRVGVFFNGLAVAEKDDKIGFIDSTGREVIAVEWDDIRHLESGNNTYKRVRRGEGYGLVHRSGKVLLPAEYTMINAAAPGYFFITQNGLTGLADSTGRIVLPAEYTSIDINSSIGALGLYKNGLQGLATFTGQELIPAVYDELELNYGWESKGWPIMARQGSTVRYFTQNGGQLPVKVATFLER